MISHNLKVWTMPVTFEEYVKHFDGAKNAWRKLYVALSQLQAAVSTAMQNPAVLAAPANQPWATQEDLRKMFADAQAQTAPLMGQYNQLPQDVKNFAPNPNTAAQRG